jgi:hypothetical protein
MQKLISIRRIMVGALLLAVAAGALAVRIQVECHCFI